MAHFARRRPARSTPRPCHRSPVVRRASRRLAAHPRARRERRCRRRPLRRGAVGFHLDPGPPRHATGPAARGPRCARRRNVRVQREFSPLRHDAGARTPRGQQAPALRGDGPVLDRPLQHRSRPRAIAAGSKSADDRDVIRAHALGALPRPAARLRAQPGDALVSRRAREPPSDRQRKAERELRARTDGAAHARRPRRLHPARRHGSRALPHRLDGAAEGRVALLHKGRVEFHAGAARRRRQASCSASRFPPGSARGDLDRVLDIVAAHPPPRATSPRNCAARFIADEPPARGDRRSSPTAFTDSRGDIQTDAARALRHPPDFAGRDGARNSSARSITWSRALRATNAETDAGPALTDVSRSAWATRPSSYPTPDGYPATAQRWLGTLLWRWKFAVALASDRIAGTQHRHSCAGPRSSGGRRADGRHLLGRRATADERAGVCTKPATALALLLLAVPALQALLTCPTHRSRSRSPARDDPRTLVVVFLRGAADGLSLVPPLARRRLPSRSSAHRGHGEGCAPARRHSSACIRSSRRSTPLTPAERSRSCTRPAPRTTRARTSRRRISWSMAVSPPADGSVAFCAIGRATGTARSRRSRWAPSCPRVFARRAGGDGLRTIDDLHRQAATDASPPRSAGSTAPSGTRSARRRRDTFAALRASTRCAMRGTPRSTARCTRATTSPGTCGRSRNSSRRGVGLDAACIDLGGWDSHFTQSSSIDPLMTRLGTGLAAFHRDLGPIMATTTVVVMTEFGRRVAENAPSAPTTGAAA